MHRFFICLITCAVLFGLAACSSQAGPAQAVQTYIEALANKNADELSSLSCASWEEAAQLELDSFEIVETRVEGLACQETGTEGDTHLVQCQGKIIASYNSEDQELDLSAMTYQVVQENGDWRVCGYR